MAQNLSKFGLELDQLVEELRDGRLTRREFVRKAVNLGVFGSLAYSIAAREAVAQNPKVGKLEPGSEIRSENKFVDEIMREASREDGGRGAPGNEFAVHEDDQDHEPDPAYNRFSRS